jgi:hypothetical protein
MKQKLTLLLAVLLLPLTALSPLQRGARAQAVRPLLVVVAHATGMTDISSALLRRAFGGYSAEYEPGKRLLPLNHPITSPERQRFDRVVLGLAPDEVGRFWVDQRIRNAGQPPRTLPSPELAVRVVLSFAGAITYTTADMVKPGLNVLSIDGKAPTDPNYVFAGR